MKSLLEFAKRERTHLGTGSWVNMNEAGRKEVSLKGHSKRETCTLEKMVKKREK